MDCQLVQESVTRKVAKVTMNVEIIKEREWIARPMMLSIHLQISAELQAQWIVAPDEAWASKTW